MTQPNTHHAEYSLNNKKVVCTRKLYRQNLVSSVEISCEESVLFSEKRSVPDLKFLVCN